MKTLEPDAPPHRLELTALTGLPRIAPGDDLAAMILAALDSAGLSIAAGDVIVIAQKIVSKAEGRLVRLDGIEPSPRAVELAASTGKDPRLVELILAESHEILRCRPGLIIVEDRRGLVLANAGIDASNVAPEDGAEFVLLLPEDPDASADRLRARLESACGCSLAVVINDSIGRAWRNGTIGTAIGVSGLPALLDLRGEADLFGRVLKATEIGLADELAAAASLLMGQADEGRPVVLVRGVPYARRNGTARDLQRERSMDLFR
jgi:coenzyme F420-0:L-glutamate ligase / coenzyme F420-1:gamma-L-glutamate ligase